MKHDCDCPECAARRGRLARAWVWLEEEPQGTLTGLVFTGALLALVFWALRSVSDVFPG